MTQTTKETVQGIALTALLAIGLGLLNYWDSGKVPQSLGDIVALIVVAMALPFILIVLLRPIIFLITGK